MKYCKYLTQKQDHQVSRAEHDQGGAGIVIGVVTGILLSTQVSLIAVAEANPAIDSELVAAICGANQSVAAPPTPDILAQCTTCPSFTTLGMSGEQGQAQILAVTYGSFTQAGQTEAIVDLSGCERHVNNFGGSVVLQKSASAWTLIRYAAANRSHTCQQIKTQNQRDALVCIDGYAQGGYELQWLSLKEFEATETQTTPLLEAESNVASCNPPFVEGKIVNFTLQDHNNDGWDDLIVEVSSATDATGEKECDNCCETNLSTPTVADLVFTFDGGAFAATPEAVQQLQYLPGIRQ